MRKHDDGAEPLPSNKNKKQTIHGTRGACSQHSSERLFPPWVFGSLPIKPSSTSPSLSLFSLALQQCVRGHHQNGRRSPGAGEGQGARERHGRGVALRGVGCGLGLRTAADKNQGNQRKEKEAARVRGTAVTPTCDGDVVCVLSSRTFLPLCQRATRFGRPSTNPQPVSSLSRRVTHGAVCETHHYELLVAAPAALQYSFFPPPFWALSEGRLAVGERR